MDIIGDFVQQVGGALLAPQLDPQRMKGFGGDKYNVKEWEGLLNVSERGFQKGYAREGTCGKNWRLATIGACGSEMRKCSGRPCSMSPWDEQRYSW